MSAALGTTVSLAGCGSDGDGDGTTTSSPGTDDTQTQDGESPSSQEYDRLLRSSFPGGENIQAYHFNPFRGPNSALQGQFLGALMYDPLFITDLKNEEIRGVLAEDWGFEGDSEPWVQIRDDYTWHDGTPLTTEALEILFGINRMEREHFEDSSHSLWSDFEVEDDYTIRFDAVEPFNETYFFAELDPLPVCAAYPGHFRSWYDDLTNAGPGSDEFENTLSNLREDTEAPAIGFGPFALDERTSNLAELSTHEGHPASDEINFSGWQKESVADPELAFVEGQIDHSRSVRFPLADDMMNQLDEDNVSFHRSNYNRAQQMMMNVGFDPETGERRGEWHATYEREVRKSIAHVVNNELVATTTGDNWEPYSWPSSSLPIARLEDDAYDLEGWTNYSGKNDDRAIELINQSDRLYYEDGVVRREEDNEQASLELMAISGRNEFMGPGQVATDNLMDFGWDVTFATVDDATYDDRRRNGEFDLYFDGQRFTSELGLPGLYTWWQSTAGFPDTLEVPMPIGDPDGDLGTVDLIGNLNAYNLTKDEDERHQLKMEMNWALNQFVAQAITTYIWNPVGLRTDHFELGDCDPWLKNNFNLSTFVRIPGEVCLRATE